MSNEKRKYAIDDCVYANKRILPVIILFEAAMIAVQRMNLSAQYTSGSKAPYYLGAYFILLLAGSITLASVLALDKKAGRSAIAAVTNIFCIVMLADALFITYLDARQGLESVIVYAAVVSLVPLISLLDNPGMITLELAGDGIMIWIGSRYYDNFSAFFVNFCILSVITLTLGISYRKIRLAGYEDRIRLKELLDRREKDAYTDELTGLGNRRAYHKRLEELEKLDDPGVSLWVFDINGLKEANDSLGHSAGDRLIRAAVECIAEGFGGSAGLYRTGGDEFVVIDGANCPPDEVKDKILRAGSSGKWPEIGNVSVSMGCAARDEAKGMSLAEMEKLADSRMYEAKNDYYSLKGNDRRKVR